MTILVHRRIWHDHQKRICWRRLKKDGLAMRKDHESWELAIRPDQGHRATYGVTQHVPPTGQ